MLGGYPAGAPLHDPCVIAWLLQPALFTGRPARVTAEVADAATMGRTVADWDAPPNATVIECVETDGLFALLMECLGRL
jgi:purine nucleosidase